MLDTTLSQSQFPKFTYMYKGVGQMPPSSHQKMCFFNTMILSEKIYFPFPTETLAKLYFFSYFSEQTVNTSQQPIHGTFTYII